MVIYDLICPHSHKFEGWFQSMLDYETQREKGLLSCPMCDSSEVRRVPTASYVNTMSSRKEVVPVPPPDASKSHPVAHGNFLNRLRDYLETQSRDVGDRFAEEVKKMHYGEAEKSNIHGVASVKEVVELHEEGIDFMPLPVNLTPKKELN